MARRLLGGLLLACVFFPGGRPAVAAPGEQVHILLWFDTEDYVLRDSDDALLRLCRFLSDQGVRATFKIVGEKARVLEQRGRRDILSALSRHEVGYHTNFHSVQPSPAMYLAGLGWFEGVREFDRRERQGVRDVERITGQYPTCYGQPGSSWGPQQYGGLKKWNVPVYLDDGGHVSMDGLPFWYAGILTFFNLKHTLRTGLDAPGDVRTAIDDFERAYAQLKAEGGGVVSVYYHPCEFVHQAFWDAVNFSNGANPPPEEWKAPPLKSPSQIETAFSNFEAFIRHVVSRPGVRFVTASEAQQHYPDRARDRSFQRQELVRLAEKVLEEGVVHQGLDGLSLAPSEIFLLLGRHLKFRLAGQEIESVRLSETPLGPVRPAPHHGTLEVTPGQFRRGLEDVMRFLEEEHRIPEVVWLGASAVSPESFLVAMAELVRRSEPGSTGSSVRLRPTELQSARHVRNDADLWNWVIFPEGFEAPEMMELAKRQAWTLKPALLQP